MNKILLIDDDLDILESLKMLLEIEGYEVNACNNSKIFKDIFQKKYIPNLILLDVLLSGEDGRILCNELKKNPVTNKIPVILVSAFPKSELNKIACEYDDFIFKPFNPDILLEHINKFLNSSQIFRTSCYHR